MSQVLAPPVGAQRRAIRTAADLVQELGPIPLERIVSNPAPGTATVDDVVRLEVHEDRLCELIDGTLVEKTMCAFESHLAGEIVYHLKSYLREHEVGIALTTDGMMQLFPEKVRIPDVSFISWDHLEGSGFPETPAPDMAPDLAVEVLSTSNTPQEMQRKLREYFTAGARLVWYVDPKAKTVDVYTSPEEVRTVGEADVLDGGEVLSGFELPLKGFFQMPQRPDADASSKQTNR